MGTVRVERALLRPVLKHGTELVHGGAQGFVVFDADPQRLFHVDVLAGAYGSQGDGHVPVIGRGHDHRVDIVAGQQFPEVLISLAALVGALGRGGRVMLFDAARGCCGAVLKGVADGDALPLRQAQESAQQAAALAADADVPQGHAFARRRSAEQPRGQDQWGRDGRGRRR